MKVESAFLVVKRFEVLYRNFAQKTHFNRAIYALPEASTDWTASRVRYHGLDRNPITAWDDARALAAQIRIAEIGEVPRWIGCYLLQPEDVTDVLKWAEAEVPGEYEPIWARLAGSEITPPMSYRLVGYEPSFFPGGYFSASCDCMCFPRWHGTDVEGVLFSEHFKRLNNNGLFESSNEAVNFLSYYLSFDWTEQGDFTIIEDWIPDRNWLEQ
jgi:hypothetical protein